MEAGNMLLKNNPTESGSWKKLEEHFDEIKDRTLKDLFAEDRERFLKFSIRSENMLLDYSKNKILSNSIEETFEYTIKVKNIRDISMKVKIEEQIPIAKSEDIVVNIITLGDAHYDLESGILTWALSLKAKETITLKYIYTLKRPKDKKVDVVF